MSRASIARAVGGGLILLATACRPAGPEPPSAVTRPECCAGPDAPEFVTPWLEPARRRLVDALDAPATTEDGVPTRLDRLVDRPTALAYFYTRCDNPNKCSRTVSLFADLQRRVEEAGLGDRVRLLLLTFEPESDTPELLSGYGQARGVRPGSTARLVRPDPGRHLDLQRSLEVAVNYSGGLVNLHGIGLHLLDGHGRYVRDYRTLAWDNERVLSDLRRLVEE